MTVAPAAGRNHLAGVWGRITDLTIARGEGARVETVDGRSLLDFTAGIAVCSTGHCHPKVVDAIREQAGRVIHAQVNCYHHDLLAPLATRLAELAPGGIDRFFFSNSGAEAVEAAVKLAKQATRRPNVVVFSGSFHGRTHLTMAMTTSKSTYRVHSQPLPAGIFTAPFPDLVGVAEGADADAEVDRCLRDLRTLLATQCDSRDTAALVIEPVQGEGGFRPVPPRFFRGLREICDEHGILLVADEVQSGFGRTGTMFAVEQLGVDPDIIVLAKGIASGMPLSAVGATSAVMEKWIVGSHGGTYGANALSCAAALATIDVITDQATRANIAERAVQLREALDALAARDAGVRDVRGLGLMLAIEFTDPARVGAIVKGCLERDLIITTAGHTGATIRFMPPLVVTQDEMAEAIATFTQLADATAVGSDA